MEIRIKRVEVTSKNCKPTMTAHKAFGWNLGHMPVVKYRGDPEEWPEIGVLIVNYKSAALSGYTFIPFGTGKAYNISGGTPVEMFGTIEVYDE